MGIVTLLSGGLDSSLVAVLAAEEGVEQFPLFIDYGQINKDREWAACVHIHQTYGLPSPKKIALSGWGETFPSGLTDASKDIVHEAFLPNRNLLFLLAGSAYAHQQDANGVAIGLLNDAQHIFPDQTKEFVTQAEEMVSLSLGRHINLLTPLIEYTKADVIATADARGLTGTYSCHAGGEEKCGICISCMEFNIQQVEA